MFEAYLEGRCLSSVGRSNGCVVVHVFALFFLQGFPFKFSQAG